MAHGLTEDDLKRIEEFVRQPRHRRSPTMLCPDAGADDDPRRVDRESEPDEA